MGKWIKLFGLWLISCLSQPLIAQQTSEMDYPVIVGTMVGVGGYNLMDTYLTPGIESRYTGWGVRLRDERMLQLLFKAEMISAPSLQLPRARSRRISARR